MTKLAFVDIETTSLDRERAEVWEVGLIIRDPVVGRDDEFVWQLPVDLFDADPMSLKISGFYERRWVERDWPAASADEGLTGNVVVPANNMGRWAREFVKLTLGAHLVGNVPSFDDHHLQRLLRRHNQCAMWHYHLVDVEALAAGSISAHDEVQHLAAPPWDSEELSRACYVDPDQYDRHSALGDARWARDLYDAVIGTDRNPKEPPL